MINSLSQKGINYSLYFIAVSFPLHYNISNFGIAFLVLSSILNFLTKKNYSFKHILNKNEAKLSLALIGLFALYLISLVYTNNLSYGTKILEYKLSLFVLPIVFLNIDISKKTVLSVLKVYSISIVICSLFLLFNSIVSYYKSAHLLVYEDFSSAISLHAIFLSYYTFLAILIIEYLRVKNLLKSNQKLLAYIGIPILIIALVFLASKNVMVILLLFAIIYFTYKFINRRFKIKELFLSVIVIVIITALSFQLTAVKNRVVELRSISGIENIQKIKSGEKLEHVDRAKFNGTSLRLTLWYLGIDKLMDQNQLFLGLSPGDYRDEINEVYDQVGLNPWFKNYNMHNQFIQILVELGIVGLISYLLIYISAFKIGLRTKNYLFLIFLISILFFQMSESIIERNKGIVFVVFFILLLPKLKKVNE